VITYLLGNLLRLDLLDRLAGVLGGHGCGGAFRRMILLGIYTSSSPVVSEPEGAGDPLESGGVVENEEAISLLLTKKAGMAIARRKGRQAGEGLSPRQRGKVL